MNNGLLIGFLVLFLLLISHISQELGVTTTFIIGMSEPASPDSGNWVTGLLNVIMVAVNLVWSFVQIMTFQVDGIPAALNTFIMLPMSFMIGYVFIRVIRGGG